MTPEQIKLVQGTFAQVAPIAEKAAAIFYDKLFELDPSLKSLFKSDIKEQGKKLMSMLASAVNGLNRLDALVPVVQDLGKRHVGYGVNDSHYTTVGAALLYTLETGMGDKWNSEVKDAWVAVYTDLSETMIAASKEA